jgi:hypothetical protein
VAEPVLGRRAAPDLDDQIEALQLREGANELVVAHQALEERHAESAPDRGREAEDLARVVVEAVEPRLQRCVEEGGDGELVEPDGELPAPVLAPQRAPLDEVPNGLLEEERVAAGALGQELRDRGRYLAARGVRGHRPARVRRQRAKLDLAVAVREAGSGALPEPPRAVLALGPVEEKQRDGRLLRDAEQILDELEGRLVGPVQVLEDEADGLPLAKAADELEEELERSALDRLAVDLAQALGRVGLEREADEAREEGIRLVRVRSEDVRELRLQLDRKSVV